MPSGWIVPSIRARARSYGPQVIVSFSVISINLQLLSKSFASTSSKQRRRSFINATEKAFALYFIHETCVNKVFPVPRFCDLHEFEKNRGVFRTRVRNFGKNLQPKIIGLLQNLRVCFA